MSGGLRTQVGQLARRSILRTLRQPAQIVPALIFPLFLLAVNSGGLKDATNLPGFPTDSYLTFALAVPFMQGALFSVMNSGTDLARDIETGFLNRLALTPLRGVALLSGLLAGSVVLGLVQAVTYLVVGLTAGAELAAGVGGALVIVALSVTITVAFGTVGLFAALRTGSGEAVQSLFPVFFVFLFLSSMALPLDLLQTDWFHAIASANPVSYLLQAFRSLLIEGWNLGELALGFGIAGGDPAGRHVRRQRRPEDEAGADVSARHPAQPASARSPSRSPGAASTSSSATPPSWSRRWSSRSSSSSPSPAGSRRSPTSPASTSRPATPPSSSSSCCCSRPPSAASSPASGSPAISRPGSPAATCSPPATAAGSSPATPSPRWSAPSSPGPS